MNLSCLLEIRNGYKATIVYVYQNPYNAWYFTKTREKIEGRRVPKDTFINAFFQSRKNIEKIKLRHPEIELHIVMKDFQNNIADIHYSVSNISLVLPQQFTREELERNLND